MNLISHNQQFRVWSYGNYNYAVDDKQGNNSKHVILTQEQAEQFYALDTCQDRVNFIRSIQGE